MSRLTRLSTPVFREGESMCVHLQTKCVTCPIEGDLCGYTDNLEPVLIPQIAECLNHEQTEQTS
ncbi:hypothetical protein VPHD292_0101 [Vibrio phage D292]